jgi:hypothetical protein
MTTPSRSRSGRRQRCTSNHETPITFALPPARAGRADFHLLRSRHYVLVVPASTRGDWFLSNSPLADPSRLIPRIGPARLLQHDYAAVLLPALAQHFRLRYCPTHLVAPSIASVAP